MDLGIFEHWGVVVRPGETVKCDPGEIYCHLSQIALQAGKGNEDVRVFVKVDGKEILIGTLSVDKYPQYKTDLVFNKEFELLHTSKTSNISAIGYKFSGLEKRSDTSTTDEDDESDEEVPLAIPLYPNADDGKSKETKSGADKVAAPAPGPAATQSSKPKPTLEETKNPGRMKADVGDSDEDDIDSEDGESGDEDSIDKDDSDSSDEDDDEEGSPENAKGKSRPSETPLKTPPEKKAKIVTPSMDNKTVGGTAMKSGRTHVATPYPSKQVKKTRSTNGSSKRTTSYPCNHAARSSILPSVWKLIATLSTMLVNEPKYFLD